MATPIVPGNRPLTHLQENMLKWIGSWGGRDIVLAIDLTESVGLNDPGRLHLRQIAEKTLTKGDTLHIISFATTTHPPIVLRYQGIADIPKILEAIPMHHSSERGTDIQCAELQIYKYLAEQNQKRLREQQPIKAQSVVWLTDAPLNLPQGQSQRWIEAPNSPCGASDSPEATERTRWLEILPMTVRSIQPGSFQLTIVDISPTVQEFCTPRPGGGEVCLVNDYLWGQLRWTLLLIAILAASTLGLGLTLFFRVVSQQVPWRITVRIQDQEQSFYLKDSQKIGIGGLIPGTFQVIQLPEFEPIGYLERQNQKLRICAFNSDLMYNGQMIINRIDIPRSKRFIVLTYKNTLIKIII
ncbi:MAG: hypothetical protein Q6L58_04370 [Thermostichales cyanobacterium BF3_bins_165]